MTFQQHLMEQVSVIDQLLRYLPFCDYYYQRDMIMSEVVRIRREVMQIEEMTKTERQMDIKVRIMTIESKINVLEVENSYICQ